MKALILGAGVVGVTTAYFLHRAGFHVTVLDRQSAVGEETSFANGGQLSFGSAAPWANPEAVGMALRSMLREDSPLKIRLRADPALLAWGLRFLRNCPPARMVRNTARLLALGLESREALAELRAQTGIAFDHRSDGILLLYRHAARFARAARAAEAAPGDDRRVLNRNECLAVEPALASSRVALAGGLYHPRDASGDAHAFTLALARWLKSEGVPFLLGRTLRRLAVEGERIVAAETDRGDLSADHYILCLGSESPRLVRPLGLKLPIYPVKGYSVTLPVGGANRAPTVSIGDETRKIVISRLGERLRAAGTAELAGYDRTLNPVRSRSILDSLLDLFPEGGDASAPLYWAGLRPMTPDGAPIVGPTHYRNLHLNTGHGTLGWTLSAGTARLLARGLAGEPGGERLAELSHQRF